LDRLGIPLVEVTTKPDINDPNECREAAERLGLLLWTSNVKKVLGSIRQDINVSIREGTRVEIKGVQKLDWIPVLINHEISRQLKLVEIKDELEKRELNKDNVIKKPKDLTKALANTKSNFISKGIKSGKKFYGISIRHKYLIKILQPSWALGFRIVIIRQQVGCKYRRCVLNKFVLK